MQEPPPPSRPVILHRQPRPWATWFLVASLLLALAYLLNPDIPLRSWVSPPSQQYGHQGEATIRPRIILHPEDHIYRLPETQHLEWRISSGQRRPDGVLKQVYLINDLFPGPTIEARSGDTLMIEVNNALQEESITLHWHGLHVSNAMDGAAGVSQCPITPGGRFLYNITIPFDQNGTFWYHAHSGTYRADGLYGGLVVHAPAAMSTVRGLMSRGHSDADRFSYQKELLLLIGDWYHEPANKVLAWYMLPGNFGNEPVPDSLLINGAGRFNCSMAAPARPLDCLDRPLDSVFLNLEPDIAYRVRVVNTGALAGLSLVFGHGDLDLIQVDSVDVERSSQQNVNSAGILYPGQRMDFILRPPLQRPPKSSVMVQLDKKCFRFMNPTLTPDQVFAISYQSQSAPEDVPIFPPIVRGEINLEEVPSAKSVLKPLPSKADQTHLVYTKIQKLSFNNNVPLGSFNHTTWKPQEDPPIPLIALPRNHWDTNQFSFSPGPDPVWVDLVVNNLDESPHPFHLVSSFCFDLFSFVASLFLPVFKSSYKSIQHGYHFYILTVQKAEYGWGSYNPFEDDHPPGLEPSSEIGIHREPDRATFQPYDLTRASLRDTVQIPSRGYAVLRFRADNPGVWLFHCHILWHLATGMAMLVDVQGDPAGELAHDTSVVPGGVCAV
ncbi:multicopper oxidase-domain-containing protein [Penicillium hispanicum]|uniref:multicopper oxidase-domain-containing protein n=1 Tax=Penicillium hispanicum TaxID=1080232 RepID=UPI0025422E5F|nr:multicopper oxidase-domain-containing protein [Penicillium hispanicum]KAJ5578572.1 multicopper oxidase-domain-containing protein [Penicillium hispanicum]